MEDGQRFKDGSAVSSPSCERVQGGRIDIQSNPARDELSGVIDKLKVPIDYYVPEYELPSTSGQILRNSGSTRNYQITFVHLKRKAN